MKKSTATTRAEALVKSFESLPKREQEKVFLRLVQSSKIRDEMEDLMDAAVAAARRKEHGRPLRDILAETHPSGK